MLLRQEACFSCRATWENTSVVRRQKKGLGHGCYWVSQGEARQGGANSLGLANWNSLAGPWGIGVVPACLVPGPGMVKASWGARV